MANNTSQHILNTAANLLGFCLFVITSLHISSYAATSIVDEFTSLVAFLLVMSCIFSFFSIRTKNDKKERIFETIAEYIFALSLLGICFIIVMIAFHFIK